MTECSINNGILVFIEKKNDAFSNISNEVIAGANKLSEIAGCHVDYIVIEDNIRNYDPASFIFEITEAVKAVRPSLILMGSTPLNTDIAAVLAAELEAGILCDCIDVTFSEEGGFCPVRPDAAGSKRQIMKGKDILIVTVRPGTFNAEDEESFLPKHLTVIKEINCSRCSFEEERGENVLIELLNTMTEKKHDIDISRADILVSGGRGVGGPEGFKQLRILADLLGGEVAASRACIEAGWAQPFMQVGQTGKTVHPKLYIACGISGAIQHVTGMKDSELIIAINKNPAAPIFDIADLGIVGNLENILPALVKTLQEKKGGTNAI